jgi:hypothetical protein
MDVDIIASLTNTVVPALSKGLERLPVPCDEGDTLAVALVDGRLSITHVRLGHAALWAKLPPTPEGLTQAQKARDALLACGIDWSAETPEAIGASSKSVHAAYLAIQHECEAWLRVAEPDDDDDDEGEEDDDESFNFDAEAIIAYDRGRPSPASAEIHACIRKIADNPHLAPLYLADLIAASKGPVVS